MGDLAITESSHWNWAAMWRDRKRDPRRPVAGTPPEDTEKDTCLFLIQQTRIEHLHCAMYCNRFWGYKYEKIGPCPQEVYSLVNMALFTSFLPCLHCKFGVYSLHTLQDIVFLPISVISFLFPCRWGLFYLS